MSLVEWLVECCTWFLRKKMKQQRGLDSLFLKYQNSILDVKFDVVIKAMIRKKQQLMGN